MRMRGAARTQQLSQLSANQRRRYTYLSLRLVPRMRHELVVGIFQVDTVAFL